MARNHPICQVCGSRKQNLPADPPSFLMQVVRCPTPERHEPSALVETVRAAQSKVLVKRKLSFEMSAVGTQSQYPLDTRTLHLQYADGARFIVCYVWDGLAEENYITVNDVRIPSSAIWTPEALWRSLTCLSLSEFDAWVRERLGARVSIPASL